jgi:hypothetical protein
MDGFAVHNNAQKLSPRIHVNEGFKKNLESSIIRIDILTHSVYTFLHKDKYSFGAGCGSMASNSRSVVITHERSGA